MHKKVKMNKSNLKTSRHFDTLQNAFLGASI